MSYAELVCGLGIPFKYCVWREHSDGLCSKSKSCVCGKDDHVDDDYSVRHTQTAYLDLELNCKGH